jgi:hypothetical protein
MEADSLSGRCGWPTNWGYCRMDDEVEAALYKSIIAASFMPYYDSLKRQESYIEGRPREHRMACAQRTLT